MNGLSAGYFDSHTAVLGKKAVVGTLHVRPGREDNINTLRTGDADLRF